jgi:hypothetical protein
LGLTRGSTGLASVGFACFRAPISHNVISYKGINMKYKVTENDNGIDISIADIKDKKNKLMEAFQECKEGRCSCPTEEYKNMESLEIKNDGDDVILHLKSKGGSKINKSEINKCLEFTAERVEHDGEK